MTTVASENTVRTQLRELDRWRRSHYALVRFVSAGGADVTGLETRLRAAFRDDARRHIRVNTVSDGIEIVVRSPGHTGSTTLDLTLARRIERRLRRL